MTPDEHIAHLERDGEALAAAAERAGWDAPVPGTQWDVRALVTHIGGVHRWAADIVRCAEATGNTALGDAVGTGPDDDALLGWFRDGHAALVAELRGARPDLECFNFLPAPSPLAFWCRRQAHETAIHRADAEAAAGEVAPYDAAFAQDGIAELLFGFAARKSNAIPTEGVLALRPDDGTHWRIVLGGERIESMPDAASEAGAVVSGTSSDIYLWLWNRPSAATVEGDTLLANQWRSVRVEWS